MKYGPHDSDVNAVTCNMKLVSCNIGLVRDKTKHSEFMIDITLYGHFLLTEINDRFFLVHSGI